MTMQTILLIQNQFLSNIIRIYMKPLIVKITKSKLDHLISLPNKPMSAQSMKAETTVNHLLK